MGKLTKAQVRRAVQKKEETLSDEELFSSDAFREMMQDTVSAVCSRLGDRNATVRTEYSPRSNMTAFTNGGIIHLNSMAPMIRGLPTRWEKYVSNFGLVTHECGHILHTDFVTLNKLRSHWGGVPFSFGKFYRPDDETRASEIEAYCKSHPGTAKVYAGALSSMCNTLEDAFIENCLYEEFDGLCAAGLQLNSRECLRASPTEKELYGKVIQGEISQIDAAAVILLINRFGGDPASGGALDEKEEQIKEKISEVLERCAPFVEELYWEYAGEKRAKLYNEVALRLFDLLPMQQEQTQNESNQEGSSETDEQTSGMGTDTSETSPDISSPDADRLYGNARAMEMQSGASEEAQGITRPIKAETDREASKEGRQQAADAAASESVLNNYTSRGQRTIAQELFLMENELEHLQELRREADQLYSGSRPKGSRYLGFSGYLIDRPPAFRRDEYERIYKDVKRPADALRRKLDNILKDRKEGGTDTGYLMGQRFVARDVCHNDGKYFSRELMPDGPPDAVFGLMIDESGSMRGYKSERAREAAILLEDVLRKLDVGCLVIGHDSNGIVAELNIYADFDTNDGYDSYRLAGISTGGRNCDGAVITYMGERLLKRPEQHKVLLVISDGCPTESSFYDADPQKDTVLAVERYRRAGIRIFGAVIDKYNDVKEIYGENYCFECSENGSLQRSLMKIVKRYVLK